METKKIIESIVAKNGKFTTKEEDLLNFFILNYNKNKSL